MALETTSARLKHLLLITKAGSKVKRLDDGQRTTYNNIADGSKEDGPAATQSGNHMRRRSWALNTRGSMSCSAAQSQAERSSSQSCSCS